MPDRVFGSLDGERCNLDVVKPDDDVDMKYADGRYAELPGERGNGYWASYLTVMSISFAGFIDYSVIMPSAKGYCDRLHTSNTFYGLSLAFYPLARILLLPFAGLAGIRFSAARAEVLLWQPISAL